MAIYEPSDDSFMLARHVREHAKGKVLDMGTGSGIQAETAAQLKDVSRVLGVDIDRRSVEFCREHVPKGIICFEESDLFSQVKGTFDTIIFNPPYLPMEEGCTDIALIGGKQGYETIERFLDSLPRFLAPGGHALLLFSSLTGKQKVDELILANMLDPEELERKRIFYEELFVYKITRSKVMEDLAEKGITDIKRFSKGRRGLIFTGRMGKKVVAIKVKNPASKAIARIEIEGNWLKKMNKKGIGPTLVMNHPEAVVYEFIEGSMIEDFLLLKGQKAIAQVLLKVMRQMRTLDLMGVDKEEMHHPFKHIIVKQGNIPVLLDFERVHAVLKPKNVTQFCQYLTGPHIANMLAEEGIRIDRELLLNLASAYKNEMTDANWRAIEDAICNSVPK